MDALMQLTALIVIQILEYEKNFTGFSCSFPVDPIARTVGQAVVTQDSLALVNLYNSTNGPQWYAANPWLQGPVAEW